MKNVLLRGAVLAACVAAASTVVPGSAAPPDASTASVSAAQPVRFRVSLPLRNKAELDALLEQLHDERSPLHRHWLTPEQFRARFGADDAKLARVTRALQARGLSVVATHATGVTVEGTAASAKALVGADLVSRRAASGRSRLVTANAPQLPAELATEGAHVAAFHAIPEHRVQSRRVRVPDNRVSPSGPYWFTDLKQAYDFPSVQVYSGRGRTIAIVMANDFSDADMAAYFGHEKLAVPRFVRVPVLGGAPFDADLSAETTLDLQQSGGLAPRATIKLFNVPDLYDESILAAYQKIVDEDAADIVSSSFGLFEAAYAAAYNDGTDFTFILDDYEAVFAQGNAQGITFVASSGDEGGLPRPPVEYFTTGPGRTFTYQPGVDHPASSPRVTAVGGTNLITTAKAGSLTSKYVSENAFGDALLPEDPYGTGNLLKGGYWGSGGGVSGYFAKPDYQWLVPTHASMRTVPDISLQMGGCPFGTIDPCPDDRSATYIVLGGQRFAVIGTSVSAPDFAGLLAVEEERLGGVRLGNVNRILYAQAALQALVPSVRFLHKAGIRGFNGYDSTGGIYDRVIGIGTPYTRNLILAPTVPAAGDPQTPTNP